MADGGDGPGAPAGPLDLAALTALLPDTVKRKILTAVEEGHAGRGGPPGRITAAAGAAAAAAAAAAAGGGGNAGATDAAAAAVADRRVRLPPLRRGGACVVDGVLSAEEASAAAAAVEAWVQARGRRPGMGSASSGGLWHDQGLRGDVTAWATKEELEAAGQSLLAAVLALLESLRPQLEQQGFDVSGRCSVQLACYPGGGARYVRHTDASPAVPGRTVTALLYLNAGWDAQRDGGQLALYGAVPHASCCGDGGGSGGAGRQLPGAAGAGHAAGEPALLVSPLAGRLLLFDSELPHEVLPAQRHRYSVTAFFYRQGGGAARAAAAAPAAAGPSGAGASAAAAAAAAGPPLLARLPSGGPAAPRIFVAVPAFRDPECQWTLRDLFVRAARPDRVSVGVVWQVDPAEDGPLARMAGGERVSAFQQQVREVRLHCRAATGPCAARSFAQQLWSGEEFVLHVDAHMRFVQGWDKLFLQQLAAARAAAGSERVVLSSYPPGYSGDGAAASVPEDAPATLLCASAFDDAGLLRIKARSLRERPAAPLPSRFWAAGLSFAPAAWLLEVPYCPHLPHLFFGEEAYMLARMATRGWRVASPAQPVAFHQWERSRRAASYQASAQVDAAARAASIARVLAVLRGEAGGSGGEARGAAAPRPPWHAGLAPEEGDWAPGGVWGLGTALSLDEFERSCGVSFRDRRIDEEALWGGLGPEAFVEGGEG